MKITLRNKFITILAILLSVCMLFGVANIYRASAKAENTTSIAQVVEGASVRVTSAESSGIKFRARLDKTEYNALYAQYEGKVKAGMIIVPSDYIAKAGGYAFTDFAAANLTVGANTIDEFDGTNEEYLEFTMSLVNLKDANYARDFEAIVFIEVDTTEAISGFETYNGKQYAYGVRDAACARNIYEVANATFNDRVNAEDAKHPYLVNGKYMSVDENGLAIVKGYVDGVADIKIAGNAPAVANNTEYYTSPYTFAKNAITGDYILNGSPKSLIVDGERKTDMHVEKGSVEIHTAKTLNATVDSNGTITTAGTSTGLRMYDLANLNNNYYAFDGKYGVGTTIDVYFTGNNMPEIMFFADKVNGNMTGYSSYSHVSGDTWTTYTLSGQKGLLFSNGFMSGAGANQAPDMYVIWGMDRAVATTGLSDGYRDVTASALVRYIKTTPEALALCQNTLASTYADTSLKYTVGTYDNNGKLAVTVTLTNVDTSEVIMSIDKTTNVDTESVNPGSIILYDSVKGKGVDTVFTCSTPYGGELVSNGTIAPDGTVTLKAVGQAESTGATGVQKATIPYLAFEGNYGIGTFVDFEFTGNNLPQVMFFSNDITDNPTSNVPGTTTIEKSDSYKGLFITNGILAPYSSAQAVMYYQRAAGDYMIGGQYLTFYGPYRIDNNLRTIGYATTRVISQDSLLTYKGLEADTTGRTYIYKVGTLLDTDNTIIVHAELTDKATGALITSATKDTGISNTVLSSGNIIAYGQIKGAGNTTTFKAGKPYASSASYKMSGATIAADGTVTLAARKTGAGIGASGQLFGFIEGYDGYNATYGPISYLGLAGEYGVGTYMDFYFTGNNMPEVMFFADNINDRMTGYTGYKSGYATTTGEKGVLISNGMYDGGNNFESNFTIWGPNRMFYGDGAYVAGVLNKAKAQYALSDGSLLTQETLGNGSYDSTNFKYTVGTYEAGNNLGVHVILYTVSGETLTKVIDSTIDTGIALTEIDAGSIVLYQTIKADATVFKYTDPYESAPSVLSQGATVAEDGTITLTGTSTGIRMYDVANLNNNYYALNGKYGVGTSVEVFFTGNNMPEIMLFADVISGNMTNFEEYTYVSGSGVWTNYTLNNNKGLLFSNGLGLNSGEANKAEKKFIVWGMDRITSTSQLSQGFQYATSGAIKVFGENANPHAMSQQNLNDNFADTPFKYTVSTYDDNGKLAVKAVLVNITTGETVGEIEYTSNIDTITVAPGSIIFYDTVKGSDTVFKIGEVSKLTDREEVIYNNFFTYSAPGTYDLDTTDEGNALLTESVFADYANAGLNTIFLGEDNGYNHAVAFAGSQAETAWNLALSSGVERIILHDDKISNLAQHTAVGKLIGANGKYASYDLLVADVQNWLSVYYQKEGFYGIRLGDEPAIGKAENFGYVYRAVKEAAENLGMDDIYILLNLLPLEHAALESYAGADDVDMREAYKEYIEAFVLAAGADEICVDSYPFKPDGKGGDAMLRGHYVALQVLAEVCKENGVTASFVLQSFEMVYRKGYTTNGWERITSANDMCMQVASVLGFGIEDFSFYTYVVRDDSNDESYSSGEGSSFVNKDGSTTDIYTYAKNAIAHAKAIYPILNTVNYNGSKMMVSDSASAYGDYYTSTYSYVKAEAGINVAVGSFDNSHEFIDLVSVSNDNSIMLVTELVGVNNVYMFQNVLTDAYATALETKTMTVTAQFNPTYQKALVYTLTANGTVGTWQTVTLTDGLFTAEIANGLAVYVMPYNW